MPALLASTGVSESSSLRPYPLLPQLQLQVIQLYLAVLKTLNKTWHSYPALGSTAIALGLSRLFHMRVLRFFPSILETQISLKSQSVQYNFFVTQSTARPSGLPKSPDTTTCGLHGGVSREQLNIFCSETSLQNILWFVYKKSTATAASVVDTITRSFSELLFVHNNRISFWLA